eukprot:12617393-Heterocapsa_arctica.AAC.1
MCSSLAAAGRFPCLMSPSIDLAVANSVVVGSGSPGSGPCWSALRGGTEFALLFLPFLGLAALAWA